MNIVIVPNFVSDTINAALDRKLALFPEAEKDRAHLYSQLIEYYNEHGVVPDFSITKKGSNEQ